MKTRWLAVLLLLIAAPQLEAQRTASNPLGAQLNVQDAGTCSTTGSFADQILPSNAATTTINLAGTFSGTLTIRLSNNGGASWTTNTSVTSAGTTSISTNGFTDVCADVTTFTSGVFQVTITTGLNTGPQGPPGPPGSGGASSALPAAVTGNMGIYPAAPPYNIKFDGRGCYGANATWANTSSTINCYSGTDLTAAQVVINGSNSVTVTFNSPQFDAIATNWLVGDTLTFTQFSGGDAFLNTTTFTIASMASGAGSGTNSVTGSYTHASYTTVGTGWIYNTAVGPFALAQGYGRSTSAVSGPFTNGGTVKIFGTNCNAGSFNACTGAGIKAVMPIGTATFVSSTQVTTTATSTAACTTNNCQLRWGTDQRTVWFNPGSPLGTVDGAVRGAGGCVTVYAPPGMTFFPFGFGNVSSQACGSSGGSAGSGLGEIVQTDAGNYFMGGGIGTTSLVWPPDNDFTQCKGQSQNGNVSCGFAGFSGGGNFSFDGADNNDTGTHTAFLFAPNAQANFWENISCVGFGAWDSGSLGGFAVPFSNSNDKIYFDRCGGGSGGSGAIGVCTFNGIQNLILTNSFCGDSRGPAVSMTTTGTVRTSNLYVGSTAGTVAVWVGNGGTSTQWSSLSDQNYGSCAANGAQIYIDNSTATAALNHWYGGNCAFDLEINGGKVWSNHSKFTGTTNGINFLTATSVFMDGGYNTVSSITGSGQYLGEANSANQVALTAAKTVLSAGWGTTAAVTSPSGGDFPIQFTITNSGTGQGASPTVTYTFPSALVVAPFTCLATQVGGTNATGTFTTSALSGTGATFTFSLTPTASSTEIVNINCVTP